MDKDKEEFFNMYLEGDFTDEKTWRWTDSYEKVDVIYQPYLLWEWIEMKREDWEQIGYSKACKDIGLKKLTFTKPK